MRRDRDHVDTLLTAPQRAADDGKARREARDRALLGSQQRDKAVLLVRQPCEVVGHEL